MFVCVGYPHTLLLSQAAKLIQEPCYPPTKDHSISADFRVNSWWWGSSCCCCWLSSHGNLTQSSLGAQCQGCGLWEWGGIRSRAWKHVLDSNPTTSTYISLCSSVSVYSSEILGRIPSILWLYSAQPETTVSLSYETGPGFSSQYLSGSKMCNFMTLVSVFGRAFVSATPSIKQEWYLLPR